MSVKYTWKSGLQEEVIAEVIKLEKAAKCERSETFHLYLKAFQIHSLSNGLVQYSPLSREHDS